MATLKITLIVFVTTCFSLKAIGQELYREGCEFFKNLKFKNGSDTVWVRVNKEDNIRIWGSTTLRNLDKQKRLNLRDFTFRFSFYPLGCKELFYADCKDKNGFAYKVHIGNYNKPVRIRCIFFNNVFESSRPYFIVDKIVKDDEATIISVTAMPKDKNSYSNSSLDTINHNGITLRYEDFVSWYNTPGEFKNKIPEMITVWIYNPKTVFTYYSSPVDSPPEGVEFTHLKELLSFKNVRELRLMSLYVLDLPEEFVTLKKLETLQVAFTNKGDLKHTVSVLKRLPSLKKINFGGSQFTNAKRKFLIKELEKMGVVVEGFPF